MEVDRASVVLEIGTEVGMVGDLLGGGERELVGINTGHGVREEAREPGLGATSLDGVALIVPLGRTPIGLELTSTSKGGRGAVDHLMHPFVVLTEDRVTEHRGGSGGLPVDPMSEFRDGCSEGWWYSRVHVFTLAGKGRETNGSATVVGVASGQVVELHGLATDGELLFVARVVLLTQDLGASLLAAPIVGPPCC